MLQSQTAISSHSPLHIVLNILYWSHSTKNAADNCLKGRVHSFWLRGSVLHRQDHQGRPASRNHRGQMHVWLREYVGLLGEAGRGAGAQPHLPQELQADVLRADAEESRTQGPPGDCNPLRQSAGASLDLLMYSSCACTASRLESYTRDAQKTSVAVGLALALTRLA